MSLIANLAREARFLGTGIRTLGLLRGLKADSPRTAADLVEQWATRRPDEEAIRFEGRSVTWAEYEAAGCRYANWGRSMGLGKGDVVALLMENRPEFLFAWLGMAKLGVITALINSNLTGHPLAHSIRVSKARLLILGGERAEAFAQVRDQLDPAPTPWLTVEPGSEPPLELEGAQDLDVALASQRGSAPAELREGLVARDPLFYIYTSGTTGSPKAANFSHYRFLSVSAGFSAMSRSSRRDRMYVVLPLYHTAGGVCAVGMMLQVGGMIVLRRRFSASDFWREARDEGVTLFQYIGELCRYLVNSPEHPDERRHRLRMALGNGLRPDVWPRFQGRFGIPDILEFYGATEGNVALMNLDGKPGAIGRIPSYVQRVMNIRLVRFDVEAEVPLRGPDGFCIECEPGEAGEALGLIPKDPKTVIGQFEGYSDKAATDKKILRDVFATGDAWFRTGDLLRRDEEGYFYFVDRIGDTFRWKGENVSTGEVAEVLTAHPGVEEANVYGVELPGADGRAGMAALVVGEGFDLDALHAHVEKELASYARPLFVRLQGEMEVTATFKHRKVDLVTEGFDPARIADPVYFASPAEKKFVPLDASLFERIQAGEIRV